MDRNILKKRRPTLIGSENRVFKESGFCDFTHSEKCLGELQTTSSINDDLHDSDNNSLVNV